MQPGKRKHKFQLQCRFRTQYINDYAKYIQLTEGFSHIITTATYFRDEKIKALWLASSLDFAARPTFWDLLKK